MSISTTTYEYIPASVEITGGGTADLIIENVSIRKGGKEIKFPSAQGIQKATIGKGSLSFSGIMAINSTIDDIISRLRDGKLQITIGSTTFSDCECKGCSINVAGSGKTAVFLKGNITYSYENVVFDLPSIDGAFWIWNKMGVSMDTSHTVSTYIDYDGSQIEKHIITGRYTFMVKRSKVFDAASFTRGDLDQTPDNGVTALLADVYSFNSATGKIETESKWSPTRFTDEEKESVQWRLYRQNVNFSQHGVATYSQTWVAKGGRRVIDEYEIDKEFL